MRYLVRAPATTANLGAGFDCAGAALDLWNELEVGDEEVDGEPADPDHLAVRAFARLASPEGLRFRFVDRIPRERGLGSSAATVALGLVAGALVAGRPPDAEELLGIGVDLEGHADNLAPALAGGVCLTWDGKILRLAADTPAAPVALVPQERVATSDARAVLPDAVPLADAAFSVARAALLGAAIVGSDPDVFAAACDDRLHEPHRAAAAPLLARVRARLPEGALGATLSGSGPSVVVWARREAAEACAAELAERFPEADVLPLTVSPTGAGYR